MREPSEERLDSLLQQYCGRTAQTAFTVHIRQKSIEKKLALAAAATVLLAVTVLGAWAAVHRQPPAPLSQESHAAPAEKPVALSVNPYAVSSEKLAALCGKGTAEKIAEKAVGAWSPSIEYADEKKIVFDVASGIFVLDFHSGELVTSFDTDKLGVPAFNQGDNFSALAVSEDGSRGLLTSQTVEESSGAVTKEFRELDMATGDVKKLDSDQAFFDRYTVFQTYPVTPKERCALPGWIFSSFAAVVQGKDYLMALDFANGAGNLSSLRLVIIDSKTGAVQASVSTFDKALQK